MGGIEKLSNSAFVFAIENCFKDKLQYPCKLVHPDYGAQYEFYSSQSSPPATIFTAESDGNFFNNFSYFPYWVQNSRGYNYSDMVPPIDLRSVAQTKASNEIQSVCDRAKNQALKAATKSCLEYKGGIYKNKDCSLYSSFQEGLPQVEESPADYNNNYFGHFQVTCPTKITIKVLVPISE